MGGGGWFWRLGSSRGGGEGDSERPKKSRRWTRRWRPRQLGSMFSGLSWRRRKAGFSFTLFNEVVFHLLYILEAIVLVAVFCFYFIRFGCRV